MNELKNKYGDILDISDPTLNKFDELINYNFEDDGEESDDIEMVMLEYIKNNSLKNK